MHEANDNKTLKTKNNDTNLFKIITRYYFTQGSVNMKIKNIFNIILCCVLIVTSLPMSVSAEELTVIETPLQTATEYAPGEIVITTKDELIDSSSTFVTYGDEDYTLIDFEEEEITDSEELNTYTAEEKTYVLEVEGDVLEKCKELEKLPGVKYAEPRVARQRHPHHHLEGCQIRLL